MFALSCCVLLTACDRAPDSAGSASDRTSASEPVGEYTIDPETGEIRATHTDQSGVTTTMKAGDAVVAELPAPFTGYPAATITYATQVEQGDGVSATIEFVSSDSVTEIVSFYRTQAKEARIAPDVEITASDTTTLAGTGRDGAMSFSLQATGEDGRTKGVLSVVSGFD